MGHRPKCTTWNYRSPRRKQKKIFVTALGENFLDMAPKAQSIREPVKQDLLQIENICCLKMTVKRMKRQAHHMGANVCKAYI